MTTSVSADAYLSYLHNCEKNLTRLYEEGRYAAFEKSYHWVDRRLNELNRSSAAYRVAVNQFSDWSEQEISNMFPVFSRTKPATSASHPEYPMSDNSGNTDAQQYSTTAVSSKTPFSTSLNWATKDNPTGMSVVPGPRNQGECGACWAFVSAGSAEGAVSIATGQAVSLSVQELIDCATEFNRGCNGGNPMFAYEYIRANGLSLWSEYPYDDAQNPKCENTNGYTKATINYDLEIPPDDEVELKWYVSKGPVAIGVCGTDMDFMYYAGGIFNPGSCCSTQNHAMLIVGYGVESSSSTPYWIVQNSWGNIWGEDGYMRMKRSIVRGAGPGVCGLATFPTMASGGHIISGNSSGHPGVGLTFGEWLLDHNEQIISVFAAACFLLSIALLILSYWFSCRRRELRETASRIKLDVIRSRTGSFSDGGGSGGRNTPTWAGNGISGSDMSLLHQKLADLAPGQHYHHSGYYTYEEDPTELSGLMDGKRLLCKTNLTPFSSLPNSRVGSRVNSRAGSPTSSLLEQRYHQYGSTIQEDAEIDV